MPEQIGKFDIVVTLHIGANPRDADDNGIFIEKRWDIQRSPFYKKWIEDRPSDQKIFFPHYPHTGDVCSLIHLLSLNVFIEFTSMKTSLRSAFVHVEASEGILLRDKDGTIIVNRKITDDQVVDALLADGWNRF